MPSVIRFVAEEDLAMVDNQSVEFTFHYTIGAGDLPFWRYSGRITLRFHDLTGQFTQLEQRLKDLRERSHRLDIAFAESGVPPGAWLKFQMWWINRQEKYLQREARELTLAMLKEPGRQPYIEVQETFDSAHFERLTSPRKALELRRKLRAATRWYFNVNQN